jgi:prolyl oligopeptidase
MLRPQWIACAVLIVGPLVPGQSGPPPAHKRPVTDIYHDVKVTDDYRWLEDWSNPETQSWSDAQNAYARKYLETIPGRSVLREQLTTLLSKQGSDFLALRRRGDNISTLHFQPPKEQPFLIVLESPDHLESARTILDPIQLDPSGGTA